jgi:hypothetical protein
MDLISSTILYNQFDSSYIRIHSVNGVNDAYFERKLSLIKIYMDMCEDFRLVEDYINDDILTYNFVTYVNTFKTRENKALWLFWDKTPKSQATKLKRIIIDKNDEKLTKNDYALLLYLSYQDNKELRVLKNLPMSMLDAMYSPVYEALYDSWYQKRIAKKK